MGERRNQMRRQRRMKVAAKKAQPKPRRTTPGEFGAGDEMWTAYGGADLPPPYDTPEHFLAVLARHGGVVEAVERHPAFVDDDGESCPANWSVDFFVDFDDDRREAAFDADVDLLQGWGLSFEAGTVWN